MNYTGSINFKWDEAKSEVCFHERGFDFAYALVAFLDPDRIEREVKQYENHARDD